jgi:exodeoxyribonuclease VII large subunit
MSLNLNNSFAPPFTSQVISVTELNHTVAHLLERSMPLCWITGEISNFTRASSGHWYFTLKDEQAQVRAVMFKNRTMSVDFLPREGEKIQVRATVTLYAPRGDYQLNVENIRRAGLGNLYEAFLQLKEELARAGLFEMECKKRLPTFPACIGIITSPQAAALSDLLTTLARRAPHISIVIYPTPVQGTGAAEKIIQALQTAISRAECDVLIMARGGGSIEDLWAFNDEQLAYAIAHCPIPIITGIGHETDFTIADFVADMRAPTPTAAAEIAVATRNDFMQQLEKIALQLKRALRYLLDQKNQTLDYFSRSLIKPHAYIRNEYNKLANLRLQLKYIALASRKPLYFRLEQLKQKLIGEAPRISLKKNQLQQHMPQLQNKTHQHLAQRRLDLQHLQTQLELLNPQRILERGYAIIWDQQGAIVQRPEQFHVPGQVTVRLAEGEVELGIATARQKITRNAKTSALQ